MWRQDSRLQKNIIQSQEYHHYKLTTPSDNGIGVKHCIILLIQSSFKLIQ